MSEIKGHITQIIGPVVDVYFENGEANLPKIHDALDKGEELLKNANAN